MLKRVSLLICLCNLLFVKIYCQVNLQTGSAVFSLPIFNWQDDKSRLHVNISLNYNSGNGLKINDIASNVGQGWNFMAGGVITRMQNGEPDDQYPNYANDDIGQQEQNDDLSKYPAGYLYNTDDVKTKGCPSALAKYPIFGDKNHIYRPKNLVSMDRELDYFAFNFNGKNGLFVLNKNDNSGFLLGDSKVKIWYTLSSTDMTYSSKVIRTRISTFFIQDDDGLIYRFGTYQNNTALQLGLSKVLRIGYCHIDGTQVLTQPQFKNGNVYYQGLFVDDANNYPFTQTTNPYIVNSWYLTEVDDPFTQRQILLSYGYSSLTDPVQTSITVNGEKDYSVIARKATQSEVPELLGITFPDQHMVACNYGAARLDVTGEKVLASVDIKYQSRYLSRYEFGTSYFIFNRYGTPVSDFEKKASRLCLLSVKKYGPDLKASNPPYLFDYYLGSDNSDDFVPPYSFPVKDIWGFYNGTNSTGYDNSAITNKPLSQLTVNDLDNNDCKGLCFLRNNVTGAVLNAKKGYAKNGLLRQIVYPAGGTLAYEYDQNTGTFSGESREYNVGGVHVSKTSLTDGGYSNGCDNPITTQYNFVLSDNSSSLWGLERPVNTMPDPAQNQYKAEGQHYTYSWHNIPLGSCSYKYQYPGIFYQEEKASLKWFQVAMQIFSSVMDIVSIIMEIKDIINVIANPTSLILDVIFGIADLLLSCSSHPAKDFTSTIYYNLDLNSINPLPVQFKRVEIVPNTGDIGKTVESFTSSDDYPLWLKNNPDFLKQQRFGHWEYGLPELITTYDKDGNKIKEVEYKYDDTYIKHGYVCGGQSKNTANANSSPCVTLTSCNCDVVKSVSQNADDWFNDLSFTAGTANLNVHTFDFYTGRLNLTDVYERTYKPAATQNLQTTTHYDYDLNSNYPQNALDIYKITIAQSNGDITYKYIKYSGDFSGGSLNTLNSNNSYSVPVETVNSIKKLSGTEQYLSDNVTEFMAAAGNIVPSRTLEQRFTAPQNQSSFKWYVAPGSSSNPPYKQTQAFNYDAAGNLTGVKDEGNHVVTNIYDYSNKYIVASVINADAVVDKPAYTSFENTGSYGGWTLAGMPGYNTTKAITGSQSFNISSGISLKVSSLNTAEPYRLTFWATSAGATVATSGGSSSLAYSGPAYNGFTYYEYNISAGASTITVAGSTTIDELRLYPQNARMRTTTYDPLIGKTSECDENNRIAYYEYDELARLKFIRDDKKNIVKMYEYNLSNKQSGCPPTYSNHLITETFTKANCSAGYQGNSVAYTVPAGKYTSSVSQAAADQQAENELKANGQTNANNNASACSFIFHNKGKSATFYTQNCPVSQYGKTVVYTVPANKYSSIISQTVVDQMEQDEIDANGQANANNPPNKGCINTTDPFYEAVDPASSRCQKDINNSQTGHVEYLMKQINPNCSNPPFGITAWQDGGTDETACPHDVGVFPSLKTGQTIATGQGVRVYTPGTIVSVTVTLNGYNSLSSSLTGSISGTGGGSVSLSGRGTTTQNFTITVPPQGYISWQLTLTGPTDNGGFISSYINFNPPGL